MMRVTIFLIFFLVTSCASRPDMHQDYQQKLLRDVEGYAIASCLASLSNSYLKDQGDAWASVIVQRMSGDPSFLLDIVEQVAIEVEKGNMAVMRSDVEPEQDKMLPVLFCSEIIYQPKIRGKILEAVKNLEPFYLN